MRRLRLTIDPGDVDVHPVGDVFHDADFVDRADLWNWNLREEAITLMFVVYGDRERVESVIEDTDVIVDHELLPVDERCFYCYIVEWGTEAAWALFDKFLRPGILSIPPATWQDGVTTATIIADEATLQSLVADIPDFVDVGVESMGSFDVATPSALSRLSPRQREALRIGLQTGYFDVPRTGSHEDVAARMDCSPSTTAEHLQKAQAALVEAVLEPA
jgi:predicted DNA binding protein